LHPSPSSKFSSTRRDRADAPVCDKATEASVRLIEADGLRLAKM